MAEQVAEAVAGRDKKRTRPTSNPVAGDTSNPVAGDRQPQRKEETLPASSVPPSPLFERPHAEKPGIALRAGRGDGSPGGVSISELVRNEEVSRRVANVEAEVLTLTRFNHDTLLDANSVAGRVGKLWKEALGQYPEDWMVADTVNSPAFSRIKHLNWGTLTSTAPVRGGSPFRERLFSGVVERFRRFQMCSGSLPTPAPAAEPDEAECLGSDW